MLNLLLLFSLLLQHPKLTHAPMVKHHHIKTVVILGNSITLHTPDASIDWFNNWGMAATAKDSDYVHRLINDIRKKNKEVQIKYMNIADFERNFKTYDLHQVDSLKNPDMLIMRIAENTDDPTVAASGFISYYDKLIHYLDPQNQSVKVITDGFWQNSHTNNLIETYAKAQHFTFMKLDDLSSNSANMAIHQFKNPGVQRHPSNKGMKAIEQRIWTAIKPYFN